MFYKKIYHYVDEIRALKRGLFVPPITCEIDPSNACQLDCEFCMFQGRDKTQFLGMDIFTDLIANLSEIGTKSVTFTGGGEPLTHPRINEMIHWALALGIQVGLVTNGVNLDRVQFPEKLTFIRISIDASDPATYVAIKGRHKFYEVLDNIRAALTRGAFVGLSFVVYEKNEGEIQQAREMAADLGVAYIQFKPACDPAGGIHKGFVIPEGDGSIFTRRFTTEDMTPCLFASLVGVVAADGKVYFCCQKRGDPDCCLGDLREEKFSQIWERHQAMKPDISKCPQCRYMNYVVEFNELTKDDLMFYDHRFFL